MKKIFSFCAACVVCLTPVFVGDSEAAPVPSGQPEKPVVWGEMPAGARTTYIGIHGGTVPVSLLSAGDGSPMIAQVGLTGSDFLHFLRSRSRFDEGVTARVSPAPKEALGKAGPLPDLFLKEPVVEPSAQSELAPESVPLAEPEKQSGVAEMSTLGVGEAKSPSEGVPPVADQEAMPATKPVVPTGNATLSLAGADSGDVPVIYATGRAFEQMSLIPQNWAPFGLTAKALALEGEVKILTPPKKKPRSTKRNR